MLKRDPSETYANGEANKWLYDKEGYCPFTRHKLESLLRLAFDAGAASIKKTGALTPKQRDALVAVLNIQIAGGQDNLRDTLGLKGRETADMFRILERVRYKLRSGEEENEEL